MTLESVKRRVLAATFFVWVFCIASGLQAAETIMPPLNSEAKAQVGGQILHQGTYRQQPAIHLSEEIKFGERQQYSLTPGYYMRTGQGLDSEAYAPSNDPESGRVKKAQGAITLQGSFLLSNDRETIGVITNFYQAVNAKAKGITRTTRPVVSTESTQRMLVYGGKKGTKIRVAYRELWKNITRPSSDVFVEFDLADSKIVKIKGARIEVIEANGESVRYRVTQRFDAKSKDP